MPADIKLRNEENNHKVLQLGQRVQVIKANTKKDEQEVKDTVGIIE